jgi:Ni/Fe-hydrogenase 1 B-type cytochrome subunit
MSEQLQQVPVWGGWYRFSHLAISVATLVLMATGWLIAESPSLANWASEVHYLSAALLIFALMLRLFLGFWGQAPERFSALIPNAKEIPAIKASLLFYLSLGKAPLPRWHSQNPLWKPLYLLLYALLTLAALSGTLMPQMDVLLGWYLPNLHRGLADVIFWLVLLHPLAVILQDWRGQTADCSAIINGQRLFRIERPKVEPKVSTASVKLDDLLKKP